MFRLYTLYCICTCAEYVVGEECFLGLAPILHRGLFLKLSRDKLHRAAHLQSPMIF